MAEAPTDDTVGHHFKIGAARTFKSLLHMGASAVLLSKFCHDIPRLKQSSRLSLLSSSVVSHSEG